MPGITLLAIDCQNDFMDAPGAALPVAGARADMVRAAALIRARGADLDRLVVTLDQHHRQQIFHPGFWRTAEGLPPAAFTLVLPEMLLAGALGTADPADATAAEAYVRALIDQGRPPLVLWPEHCLIGTPGAALEPVFAAAALDWAQAPGRRIRFVQKGSHPLTEHYGALQAEIPVADDPATWPDPALLADLETAGEIWILGEAKSHCVRATVEQILALLPGIGPRLTLIEDAMSPVAAIPGGPDFPAEAEAWAAGLSAQGVRRSTTAALMTA